MMGHIPILCTESIAKTSVQIESWYASHAKDKLVHEQWLAAIKEATDLGFLF